MPSEEMLVLDVQGLDTLVDEIKPKLHTHENEDILDEITAPFTTELLSKLDGIEENANNYVLPVATSETLGGVKVGSGLVADGDGVLSTIPVSDLVWDEVNPSSSTTYYPILGDDTSGDGDPIHANSYTNFGIQYGTGDIAGYSQLTLGNEISYPGEFTPAICGIAVCGTTTCGVTEEGSENNAYGALKLYSSRTGSWSLTGNRDSFNDYTLMLPKTSGGLIATQDIDTNLGDGTSLLYVDEMGVLLESNSNVGSGIQSVYLENGKLTASEASVGDSTSLIYMTNGLLVSSDETVGSTGSPVYLNNGKFEECVDLSFDHVELADVAIKLGTETVGGEVNPIYLNEGSPVALSRTVGSGTTLTYLNSGAITASNATVGGAIQPIFMNEGEIIATAEDVGDKATPMYLNKGEMTAISDSIGSSALPVYLSNGTITVCDSTLGVSITGNASTATNADNADVATKLGTTTVGASVTPIYLNAGVATACGSTLNVSISGNAETATTASNTSSTLYPIGVTSSATTTLLRNTSITMSGGTLTATTFVGSLSGNATTADSATSADVAAKIGTSTVGDSTTPIYINAGTPTVCGSTLNVDITGNASTADVATKLGSTTVGGTATPIYLNSGTATACSSTVGSSTKPVYMAGGTIAASDATVGSGTQPIYLSGGTLTVSSSTVGSVTQPVYLNSGTLTACTLAVTVTSITDYFCLWYSGTETPPDDDQMTAATCGVAVCGLTICGDTSGILWKAEEPYTSEGLYKWVRQYTVYSDGTTEWSTPYCLTDEYNREQVEQLQSDLESGTEELQESISEVEETIQTLVPNETIGSESNPVFVNEGTITACTSLSLDTTGNAATADVATKLGTATVGGTARPIYLNSGTATACSSTVGSGVIPVYMSSGTMTASTSTVGSGTKPIYLSSGTLTVSSSTVGSGVIPTYLSSGTVTASTSTVGSGTNPIYLSSGTLTVSSSTVGSATRPVYLSSGTITECTSLSLNTTGSAATLTTGRAIDGVTFNGSAEITHYGTCSTASTTAAKTVSLTNFTLVTGAKVAVKFTNNNETDTPTLNINSTGAKNIVGYGTTPSGHQSWGRNSIVEFIYDGTSWVITSIGREGDSTDATGFLSHAEGAITSASEYAAHSEGQDTHADGNSSHAEGEGTYTYGRASHAEGSGAIASGYASHAEGCRTTALDYQHVTGHFNDTSTATAGVMFGTSTGAAFVIGNGTTTNSAFSNAFRVTYAGLVYSKGSYNTSGADYAEFFEWEDGNPDAEDRRGYFVTLHDDKIVLANDGDYILGIISGNPSVIGNSDECWNGKYKKDEFGCYIINDYEEEVDEEDRDENGNIVIDKETMKTCTHKATRTYQFYECSEDYDKAQTYVQRAERQEWDTVGMLGQLHVRDDGTCEVNGFCKCGNNGIATACNRNDVDSYRVIERVTDNIIRIIFK